MLCMKKINNLKLLYIFILSREISKLSRTFVFLIKDNLITYAIKFT